MFAFTAYLFALFAIIGDLFRDRSQNGWVKAIWIIFLVFVPFLTALIYLIARGRGMAERSQKQATQMQSATDDYIRNVARESRRRDRQGEGAARLGHHHAGRVRPPEGQGARAPHSERLDRRFHDGVGCRGIRPRRRFSSHGLMGSSTSSIEPCTNPAHS